MKNSRSMEQLVFSHRSSFARISLYFIGILLCRLINAIREFHFFEHRTSETWTSVGGWRRIVGWKFSREKEKIKWSRLSTESSLWYVHENRICIDAIDSFHCTFGHTRDLHVQSGQKWPLFLSISLTKYDCYFSFFKYDYIIIRDKFPNIYDSLSHVISFSVLFHFRAKVHFNFFKCKYLHDLKQNFRDLDQLNSFELISFNTRKFHEQKSIPRRFTS